MKKTRLIFFLSFVLVFSAILIGQVNRQTGMIKGTVSHLQGEPIPGFEVTATSPALMGTVRSITDEDGNFRLLNLPPGTYTIMAALDGFKTAKRTDIVVQIGQTFTVNLQTELSTIKEEVMVTGTPPVVDLQSNKVSNVVSGELLRNLPLSRNITNLFSVTPGVIGNAAGAYEGAVHGANTGSTAYEIDGVNGESATTGGFQNLPQFESVEEMEITSGGLQAQVGATGGSFVSVVTKAGGNQFHGQAQFYYTAKGLNQMLLSDDQLGALKLSKPAFAKYDWSGSASLGGPIIKDKLWFFGTAEYAKNEYTMNFQDFTVDGKTYTGYTNPAKSFRPFIKLTGQINKNMRMFVMYNAANTKNLANAGYNIGYDATLDSDFTLTTATAELNWNLGTNSYINIRGGYNDSYRETIAHADARENVSKVDDYLGLQWNNVPGDEQYTTRRTSSGSARLTHFMDNVLGGNHEIGAGIEYMYQFDRLPVTRGNAQIHPYYNGNPYANVAQDLDRSLYGDSTLTFGVLPKNKGDATKDLRGYRMSVYLQDSFTINNRFTVNIGARYDKYWGGFGGGGSKGLTPDTLAYQLGQQLQANPEVGFNPYAAFDVPANTKAMDFSSISPRIGLSYDLFGNGKTALKASYGRYYEAMPVMWFHRVQSDIQAYYSFYWWDNNGNQIADIADTFKPTSTWQFTPQDQEVLKYGVEGPGSKFELKAPYNNELIVSLSHELAKNLSVKLEYVYHDTYRDHTMGNYSITLNQHLSSVEDAPGLWVPFTTTIPAYGIYPAYEATVYYPKANEFWNSVMWQQFTSPYSKRQYNGVKLTFDKRYADNWALGGSIVYSQSKSTDDTEWGELTPNNVKNYGFATNDIPLVVSLYGSFKLPLDIITSFIYRHQEGYPVDNYVSVIAPAEFMTANNILADYRGAYVRMDYPGDRRGPSTDNIDLRLEKEFKFKFATISFFADVFNLLGSRTFNFNYIPGGQWKPETNTRVIASNYGKVTGASALRVFKLSARITF